MAREVGRRAMYPSECVRCGREIRPGDRQVKRGRGWMHATCASGQDDE